MDEATHPVNDNQQHGERRLSSGCHGDNDHLIIVSTWTEHFILQTQNRLNRRQKMCILQQRRPAHTHVHTSLYSQAALCHVLVFVLRSHPALFNVREARWQVPQEHAFMHTTNMHTHLYKGVIMNVCAGWNVLFSDAAWGGGLEPALDSVVVELGISGRGRLFSKHSQPLTDVCVRHEHWTTAAAAVKRVDAHDTWRAHGQTTRKQREKAVYLLTIRASTHCFCVVVSVDTPALWECQIQSDLHRCHISFS